MEIAAAEDLIHSERRLGGCRGKASCSNAAKWVDDKPQLTMSAEAGDTHTDGNGFCTYGYTAKDGACEYTGDRGGCGTTEYICKCASPEEAVQGQQAHAQNSYYAAIAMVVGAIVAFGLAWFLNDERVKEGMKEGMKEQINEGASKLATEPATEGGAEEKKEAPDFTICYCFSLAFIAGAIAAVIRGATMDSNGFWTDCTPRSEIDGALTTNISALALLLIGVAHLLLSDTQTSLSV